MQINRHEFGRTQNLGGLAFYLLGQSLRKFCEWFLESLRIDVAHFA